MMSRLKRLVNKTYTAAEIAKMFNVEHITVRRWIKKINLDVKNNQKHIEAIKNYRLELFKRYYGDVLEMNYQ